MLAECDSFFAVYLRHRADRVSYSIPHQGLKLGIFITANLFPQLFLKKRADRTSLELIMESMHTVDDVGWGR